MTKKYFELEDLLVKASEMYEYNQQQYPEENPTMIGAIEEILYEIKKEKPKQPQNESLNEAEREPFSAIVQKVKKVFDYKL